MSRIAIALAVSLPTVALAQTMPSNIKRTGTYAASLFGLSLGAGGIEFDRTGSTLYVNDPYADRLMAVTVVRNASCTCLVMSATYGALEKVKLLAPYGSPEPFSPFGQQRMASCAHRFASKDRR